MKLVTRKPRPPQHRLAGIHFVTEYVHYRTGKRMRAVDYGYHAWPFGRRKNK
jgi:phenylalanyl-tRNA synthetase beta subunit